MQVSVNTLAGPDHRTVADNQRARGCQHRGHRRPFRLTGRTRGAPAYCIRVSANGYYNDPARLAVAMGVGGTGTPVGGEAIAPTDGGVEGEVAADAAF